MTEEKTDELKLETMFQSPLYGTVACLITIVNNGALARFSDARLAKDFYREEKVQEEKVFNASKMIFKERLNTIVFMYENQTKEEIAKYIMNKFEDHNIMLKTK